MTPLPEPVARVADLMSTFRPQWSLCGGWAVDAWLGRQTRDHLDIDISVFEDDQHALFDHLAGWQLIAHDNQVAGDSTQSWDGRRLERPAHIHASPDPDTVSAWVGNAAVPFQSQQAGFKLEILLDERSGRNWIVSLQPRISLPLRRCIQRSAWGMPTVVPEVLLFYKATAYLGVEGLKDRPHDKLDFLALLPRLTSKQHSWLWKAISLVQPGHAWLTQVSL